MDLGEGPGVRPLLFWVSQKEEKLTGQLQNKSASSLPSAQGLDWLFLGLLGMSETGSKLKTTRSKRRILFAYSSFSLTLASS